MRESGMKELVQLANTIGTPFATIAKASIEMGQVSPSRLKENLIAAGYAVNSQACNVTTRVLVTADSATEYSEANPNIVARAQDVDECHALVLAIYREVQEEARVLDCARKLNANPAFLSTAEDDDREQLQRLSQCDTKPELLTRELLVAVASNKSLMAAMAAL